MKLNLSKVRRGDPIAPQNVNQFVDAFSQLANEFGFDLEISMDTSEGLMPQDKPTRSISNATGASLPHYSVVELTEMAERNPPVFKVEISSASPTQLGIVIEDVVTGGGGNVIIAGHWYARYDTTSLPTGQDAAIKGDKFTGDTVSPIASYSKLGTIVCIEDISSNFDGLASGIGIMSCVIGGGAASSLPEMVRAEEAFAADDINYTAIYIDSDGTTGETVELKRPNGIYIKDNAMGFVVQASDGDLIFLPAIEDKLVKISSNDTTADYLIEKLAAGAAISITETTDGGDEDATVAFDFINISGYDAGETQVLTHVLGTLTWKTAVAC